MALDAGDDAFSIDASTITFGPGCLREAGDIAKHLGITRIAVFTDSVLVNAPIEIDREVLTTLYEGALSYW